MTLIWVVYLLINWSQLGLELYLVDGLRTRLYNLSEDERYRQLQLEKLIYLS